MKNVRLSLCLSILGLFLGAGSLPAQPVLVDNFSGGMIKSLDCVLEDGSLLNLGAFIQVDESLSLPEADNFADCQRLAVNQGLNEVYQFYLTPDMRAERNFSLQMLPAGEMDLQTTPYLAGESSSAPAGLPLSLLTQAMIFGLERYDFYDLLAPEYGQATNLGRYMVNAAGYSWDLAHSEYDPLGFLTMGNGSEYLERIELNAVFTMYNFARLLEDLQTLGAAPNLYMGAEGNYTFVPELATPQTPLLPGLDGKAGPESKWQGLYGLYDQALSKGENFYFELNNADLWFSLDVDLENAVVYLIIVRNSMAAFG